jgi:hypothetical protein
LLTQVLLYFVPPVLAYLFLIADTGKFNRTAILGCEIFLSLISIAVVLGEQPFVLPNLKLQFPGMPPQADRVLVFYFAAYLLFILVICPAYVLGSAAYAHVRASPNQMSHPILYAGLSCWLLSMAVLGIAIATTNKLF